MPRKVSESSTSSASDDEQEVNETIANDTVVTKYNMAAEIVNSVLKEVVANIKDGVEVGTICDLGDNLLREKTGKLFKKDKKIEKGISMPTCISIDNCICHFSPLKSDPAVIIKNGQMVKIDIGAHVDGFVATAAHTVVVGASKDNKVAGAKANVVKAAYDAMEVAIRMLRPGNKNMDITDAIDKVAAQYKVTPIENMVTHSMAKMRPDGEKQIIQNPGEKQRSEMAKCEIEKYDVWAIDVLFSTGDGKARDQDTRTTVFKKAADFQYQLKLKTSRAFYADVQKNAGEMPFTLRLFEEETKAKMGVIECEKHGLLQPYQVLYEKEGDVVAQFKTTVLVTPNGLMKITGLPLDEEVYSPTEKLTDENLVATLKSALKPKKKKAEKKEAAPAK